MVTQRRQPPCSPPNPVGERRAVRRNALPRIYLRLAIERQVVGIFADEHMRDQRLGRQPALDDAMRRRSLHWRRIASAASLARAAGHQHAKRGRDDIKPFRDILADDMQRTATAGAGLAVDINDLLDPFEVGGKPAPVGVACLRCTQLFRIEPSLHPAKRRADLFEGKGELIGIELLGACTETMPLKRVDDRVQSLDLMPGIGVGAFEIDYALVSFGEAYIGRK